MMHKEIAQRLRELDETGNWGGVQDLADELDPPLPETGTVVWWRWADKPNWQIGQVSDDGKGIVARIFSWDNHVAPWERIEWKPARIAGPRQVIVDVPRVSDWPKDGTHVEAAVTGYSDTWWFAEVITRAEAERMEAGDE